MEEVGLPKSFMKEKLIEVWNKVDLIKENDQAFKLKFEEAKAKAEYPILLMSCLEGYNKELFLSQVSDLTVDLKGKQYYILEYPSWEHGKRLSWLMRNAKITEAPKEFAVDDNCDKISIEVLLDDVVYH